MAEEASGDEIEAAPPPINPVTYTRRKRNRTGGASGSPAAAASGGAGMCDDVLRGIFARVPARTAVASMVLSKHHQTLLRCPEFRALHCRLAPPLPDPHVAYIATAKVKRRRSRDGRKRPVSGYHGFHVAGAGLSGCAPMRALAGPTCPRMQYVSTCRGVVLLVRKARPATCVLWNPAIADEEEEVRVPVSDDDNDCAVLGLGPLGCGRRSKTYKLLLSRQRKLTTSSTKTDPKELLVYALSGGGGGGGERPRLRTLLSEGLDGEISGESLYLDGTIYLLHVDKAVILAFDVDDETVTAIDLPGERDEHGCKIMSKTLLLISGRPCVETQDSDGGRALWLLTVEHQWERKCIIDDKASICLDDNRLDPYSITGVWDCSGVLSMYLHNNEYGDKDDKLCMYCTATKKMIEVNLPHKLAPPEEREYAMCWGYKPTLVSPGSIVVGDDAIISQDEEERRARTADIMAALMPLNERDRRKGHKATLHAVCFMEFLVRIMQKLPENMNEVAEMPLLKPKDSGKELYYSDSGFDSDSQFEARFMRCYKKARRRMILC
jgi:hypothetical protein